MFDAIEDIPTHKLIQELNSRKATSQSIWTPATRYRHDADELNRLAIWLLETTNQRWELCAYDVDDDGPDVALDYFRLADRLTQLAEDAREFARTMAGPVP